MNLIPFSADAAIVDLGNTTTRESEDFRVSRSAHVDFDAGIAQTEHSDTFGSLVGTTQSKLADGQVVTVNCDTTDRGFLVIEETDNGVEWVMADGFALLAGASIGLKFNPTSLSYRFRFDAMPGASVKRVLVRSEASFPPAV